MSAAGEALSRRQQLLSLAALVALPYLRARAERAFLARTGGHAQRLGLLSAEEQARGSGLPNSGPLTPPTRQADDQSTPEQQHAGASRLERLFLAAFPWAHWALEMSQFVSGLSYVLGASRVHSPLLALLRLRMARSGPAELGAFAARVSLGRAAALEAARSARLGSLRALALRACYRCVDAARPTLFAAVLAFKLSEWWFNSAEAVLRQQPRLPVPPPPPRLPLAPGGLPLPDDPRLCPACLRTRTNPALAAPSGIAFCYPCLRLALDRAGRCPVTGVSVAADQVRRLYEGTSGS